MKEQQRSTAAIALPRALVNRILTHAQSSPEAEICGLIGTLDGRPESCYPVNNSAEDAATLYRMDPKDQIDAMRQIREAGEELFAIYHSHPSSEARPSATDISESAYPSALQLIVSLNTEGVLEMRGFHINAGEVLEVPLEMER